MKKIFILLFMFLLTPGIAHAEQMLLDGKAIQTGYAKDFKDVVSGSISNIESIGLSSAGFAFCIVDVLDNGDLALTFMSDEDLEKFHKDTDSVLNKYYGGYDRTSFQHPTPNIQTHVTTMYLRRLKK